MFQNFIKPSFLARDLQKQLLVGWPLPQLSAAPRESGDGTEDFHAISRFN